MSIDANKREPQCERITCRQPSRDTASCVRQGFTFWKTPRNFNPPVVVSAEGVEAGPSILIPYSNCFILSVRNDQILSRMEQCTRYIVYMPPESIHFPGVYIRHPPELHLPIQNNTGQERNGQISCRKISLHPRRTSGKRTSTSKPQVCGAAGTELWCAEPT